VAAKTTPLAVNGMPLSEIGFGVGKVGPTRRAVWEMAGICAFPPSPRRLCEAEVRRTPTSRRNRRAAEHRRNKLKEAKPLVLNGFEPRRSTAKSSHFYLPRAPIFHHSRTTLGTD
jgi:hypothetical protein